MNEETWKPVVGFEDYYEVSDFGRVRSKSRTDTKGAVWKVKLRTPVAQGYGHQGIMLYRAAKGVKRYVYRLVLEAFNGPCPEGQEALHGDGDTQNNRLNNLRWGTRLENVQDAIRHGTKHQPATHGWDLRVQDLRASGCSYPQIARWLGISTATAWKAVNK